MEQFNRTITLIGEEQFKKLQLKKVIVFGVGGVGGYTIEALVRAGIGSIAIVDNDKVSITNLNRQIIALHSTLGKSKVDVMKERIMDINPKIQLDTFKTFYLEESENEIDLSRYDYIVDAIDTVKGKIALVKNANKLNIPIISSMGTGNKINPNLFEISDIYKTSVCPLARVMRNELKKLGIKKLKVLYSKENPIKNSSNVPSSISFVPSVAGLIIASEVVKDLVS